MNTDKNNTRPAEAVSPRIDEELGCNVQGRLKYILELNQKGETQGAIKETKKLLAFFPKAGNKNYSFSDKEKLAASIVDQLCPVIIDETKIHVAPQLFKKLTLRLAELL